MRYVTKFAPLMLLAALGSSLVACGGASEEEDADSSESEVRKRVKPKGGMGAFDLAKPTWNPAGIVGDYSFAGKSMPVDSRREQVPGTFGFILRSGVDDGIQSMDQLLEEVKIVGGQVETRKPTGLRVRFAEVPTLGKRVHWALGAGLPIKSSGYVYGDGAWAKTSALLYVPPGPIFVLSDIDAAPTEITAPEGKLTELVLPTTRVSVDLDSYDPDYPSPSSACDAVPAIIVGSGAALDTARVRNAGGSLKTMVVPHGSKATVKLNAYGIVSEKPTVAGGTVSFLLNRLEVDDVEVSLSGGGTQLTRGQYSVEVKDGNTYRRLECGSFPTHTGIDLPDGTYRVSTWAEGPSGTIRHVEEVSFP
ncbi:MAG: hypothetical protein U0174_03460 [Polyangiaceae bacterium]